jgi:predicted phage terminase large subunit-like protein
VGVGPRRRPRRHLVRVPARGVAVIVKQAAPKAARSPRKTAKPAAAPAGDIARANAVEQAQRQIVAAKRILKARQAKDSLIAFTEFTMPDQHDPDNPDKSRYDAQYFHKALAAAVEEVEAGRILRLIVTFPPRHGKSELTSRRFPAYLMGRDPYRHVIFATYNQPFAEEFGTEVRSIMQSSAYAQVFPSATLKKGSASAGRLRTEQGGILAFVGRGGSSTGRGADFLIIDDPLKDRAEANSPVTREELWNWYNDTMSTRLMSDTGAIIIIMTRWHEDDLVGRLTDPENPHYNREEAESWKIINIPAIAGDDDVLGREPGAPLWPERFGLDYLESFRRRNPSGFSALYQQKPTPDDGDFFRSEMIVSAGAEKFPKRENLRIYAASDHAVGVKQHNDYTCLLIVGVDQHDHIWLLDCWWKKEKSDKVVEAMIDLMRKWKPLCWWAESGHISKSIGPFLFKRMREEKVFVSIREQVPAADKVTRAQSIAGRMSMQMVHFPKHAVWHERARQEMLKFPQARHDDFVDTMAHIGLGLDRMRRAPIEAQSVEAPKVGTFGWVKAEADRERKKSKLLLALGGM